MEPGELITPGSIATVGTGAVLFARWAVSLWATVRREGIVAAAAAAARREKFEADSAAVQRADNDRMICALLEQARSNAQLAMQVSTLSARLDQFVEHTPSQGFARIHVDESPSQRRRKSAPVAQPQPQQRQARTSRTGSEEE